MEKKQDRRQVFTYREVTVTPEGGDLRYFGCPHGEYLTRWWRILFGPMSWLLAGTKKDAIKAIDRKFGG